ncbi:hypothetical protein VTO42DRAFT_8153 [Malbranchea cinnamomea]
MDRTNSFQVDWILYHLLVRFSQFHYDGSVLRYILPVTTCLCSCALLIEDGIGYSNFTEVYISFLKIKLNLCLSEEIPGNASLKAQREPESSGTKGNLWNETCIRNVATNDPLPLPRSVVAAIFLWLAGAAIWFSIQLDSKAPKMHGLD